MLRFTQVWNQTHDVTAVDEMNLEWGVSFAARRPRRRTSRTSPLLLSEQYVDLGFRLVADVFAVPYELSTALKGGSHECDRT
jgi:hypothetical protein